MVEPESLYKRLHEHPFLPFRVCLTDGRHYDIHFPELNRVGTTFFDIGVPVANHPEPICDYIEHLDLSEIDRFETLDGARSPASS